IDAEPGNPLRFTLSFEVLPPLEVKDYKGVSVPLSEPVVSESDVDQVLESLREQNAQLVPVDEGEIRDGHVVTLAVDGEFEGGGKALHEEDVVCTIGDPGTNSAFSENLRGARVGDEVQFNVPYPAEDQRKRFAGKTVRTRLIVEAIARQEGIEVLEGELEEEGRTLAETAKKSTVALGAQFEKAQRTRRVKDQLRRKKALDFICRNGNISRG